jgi:hypothetical protein
VRPVWKPTELLERYGDDLELVANAALRWT